MPKDSMFYATLEEAIDAAREEFLANNPDSSEESANVEQLNAFKSMCCRMAISPGRPKVLLTKRNKANASRCSAAKPPPERLLDRDYDEIELRRD
ncbi:secY/secA suppressor protein [Klebsiella pneumoniae]|nr:secY/secA suppressor protein [Klebsiella pneumoniae]